MTLEPLHVVLLGDSVSVLPGGGAYAQRCTDELARSLHRRVVLTTHAAPGFSILNNAARIDEIIAGRPEIVLFAHGGGDALLALRSSLQLRTRSHAGPSASSPPPAASTSAQAKPPSRWEVRALRALALIPGLAKAKVDRKTYEDTTRSIVGRLLRATSVQKIFLLEPLDGDHRCTPYDRSLLAASRQLALDLAEAHPAACHFVPTREHVDHWSDFARDRAHLRSTGHEKLGRALANAVLDEVTRTPTATSAR